MKVLTALAIGLLLLAGCDDSPPMNVQTASAPPPAAVKPRDGIGVAIVVDISGSMSGSVKDGSQKTSPKDVIARRAVHELFVRSQGFCQRNPERVVEVGLFAFDDSVKQIMPFAKPDPAAANGPIDSLRPNGGTAIGAAILSAKQSLDATGLTARHIVVVTDGENTTGPGPAEVAAEMAKNPQPPAVYMVAFDVNAGVFQQVKSSGWSVYSAADANELQTALDTIFGENILLEK